MSGGIGGGASAAPQNAGSQSQSDFKALGGGDQFPPIESVDLPGGGSGGIPQTAMQEAMSRLSDRANNAAPVADGPQGFEASVHKIKEQVLPRLLERVDPEAAASLDKEELTEEFRPIILEVLAELKLTDRRGDFCETLSGGLRRRVELAKGMLHRPQVMLLDEPSTGLDPSARIDLWQTLRSMADDGITVVLTTHLLEEADKADRLAIMFEGRIIAEGTPDSLRGELGDGLITITGSDLDWVEATLRDELGLDTQRLAQQVRVRCQQAPALVPRIADRLGDRMHSIAVGRPGLEDVFIAKTGYQFD